MTEDAKNELEKLGRQAGRQLLTNSAYNCMKELMQLT